MRSEYPGNRGLQREGLAVAFQAEPSARPVLRGSHRHLRMLMPSMRLAIDRAEQVAALHLIADRLIGGGRNAGDAERAPGPGLRLRPMRFRSSGPLEPVRSK